MLNKRDILCSPSDSIICLLNPVVKLIGLIIYVLLSLLEFNYFLFLFNIVFVFILLLFSNVRFINYLNVIRKFILIIVLFYVFMIRLNISIVDINVYIIKFIFFILYLFMIFYTTTIEDLAKSCVRIVDVFNILGFNFKIIFLFFINLFVFPIVCKNTYNDFVVKYEIRGNDYSYSSMIGKLTVFFKNIIKVINQSNIKMKYRNESMRYRLYDVNVKSKYKYRNKLCIFDYIFIIFNIGMLLLYILKVRL